MTQNPLDIIRILLADDHVVVREGTKALLNNEPDFTVVGEAADGDEAISLVKELRPDVAILDIAMPNKNGIQATSEIKRLEGMRTNVCSISEHSAYKPCQ